MSIPAALYSAISLTLFLFFVFFGDMAQVIPLDSITVPGELILHALRTLSHPSEAWFRSAISNLECQLKVESQMMKRKGGGR